MSLSSLTCSPPDIALAQLLKPTDELLDAREKASENQSGSTTESPILTKRKYEVHQECFSLPLVSNRGFRTEDDSDSDDYCAWRSRDVEL